MNIDFNVNNYSANELLEICGINPNENISITELNDIINNHIFENNDNSDIQHFFNNIKTRFNINNKIEGFQNISKIDSDEYDYEEETDDELTSGEESSYNEIDDNESDKEESETDTSIKYVKDNDKSNNNIDNTYDKIINSSETDLNAIVNKMKDKNIIQHNDNNVNKIYNVPLTKGILNPNYKNTTNFILNIDSKFRTLPGGLFQTYPNKGCSTDFNLNLSEDIKNVLSLKLHSYEIPRSWNAIDTNLNNNKLIVQPINLNNEKIENTYFLIYIPNGNPNISHINDSLSDPIGPYWKVLNGSEILDANTNKIYLDITEDGYIELRVNNTAGNKYNGYYIHFWESSNTSHYNTPGHVEHEYNANMFFGNEKYQNSLGWLMGYRSSVCKIDNITPTIKAVSWSIWSPDNHNVPITKLLGDNDDDKEKYISWKLVEEISYFYIVLTDYNKNINDKSVVNATPLETNLDLPDYAKHIPTFPNLQNQENLNTDCSGNNSLVNTVNVNCTEYGIFENPDGLTKKQLYSIASIKSTKNNRSEYSIPNAATDSDILAKVNIKTNNITTNTQNTTWVTSSGTALGSNNRNYFGPVDITRLGVRLIDPYGNTVSLNNRDWSFSLLVEKMYQY